LNKKKRKEEEGDAKGEGAEKGRRARRKEGTRVVRVMTRLNDGMKVKGLGSEGQGSKLWLQGIRQEIKGIGGGRVKES